MKNSKEKKNNSEYQPVHHLISHLSIKKLASKPQRNLQQYWYFFCFL